MLLGTTSLLAQDTTIKEEKSIATATVEAYYFHNTRRCATCLAVESVTKKTLEDTYAEAMKNGLVTFHSLNIEDEENEALAKKLEVSGQALLFIKNGEKKDLTNDAFMYASSNPEKLKKKIQQFIGDI